ncbi:MAG: MoaD/ThiS family protein [Betaproteobacteria bacterium]|nr:MoaD/ThiS family protein [Betaproteobacteria bacterium]
MRVLIPNPLLSYTGQAGAVEAQGATLDELTRDLDRQYPGIRFRIIDEHHRVRRHIKLFVNRDQADGNLATPLKPGDEIMIVAALSGG